MMAVIGSEPKTVFTHKELVKRAGQWLRNHRYTVVITELKTYNSETPDAIGFMAGGISTLIECKTSRADFLVDKKKYFRREPHMGMGDRRYILAPRGLISPDEVPEKWGLLEIGSNIRETKRPEPSLANKRAEVTMLTSAIRRLEISTAVFVRQENS